MTLVAPGLIASRTAKSARRDLSDARPTRLKPSAAPDSITCVAAVSSTPASRNQRSEPTRRRVLPLLWLQRACTPEPRISCRAVNLKSPSPESLAIAWLMGWVEWRAKDAANCSSEELPAGDGAGATQQS